MIRSIRTLPLEARNRLRHRMQPEWLAPMLATPVDERPTRGRWVFEPKLDGLRCLAFVRDGVVRLFSRDRKPLNAVYPEIAVALELSVRGDAILDGEIAAVAPHTRRAGSAAQYYLFDCLHYEGVDLTQLPLVDRKAVLRDVVWFGDPVRFTPYRTSGSEAMYRDACRRGAEGIIAKRAESRYVSARSADWLELKCINQRELVIGGYTDPRGSRERLGALLVGYYDGDDLLYAGKVGTGYDRETLERLYAMLAPLRRRTPPFARGPLPENGVHWVTPKLVARIGFSEWPAGGLLRRSRFLGLRG